MPLPSKPTLVKGGAAKRRGDSFSQRTFTVRSFFSVGAHSVRLRAGLGPAPTERLERLPYFVGTGVLTRPPFPEICFLCRARPPGRAAASPARGDGAPAFFVWTFYRECQKSPCCPSNFGSLYAKGRGKITAAPETEVTTTPQGFSTLSTELSTLCYVNLRRAVSCIFLSKAACQGP